MIMIRLYMIIILFVLWVRKQRISLKLILITNSLHKKVLTKTKQYDSQIKINLSLKCTDSLLYIPLQLRKMIPQWHWTLPIETEAGNFPPPAISYLIGCISGTPAHLLFWRDSLQYPGNYVLILSKHQVLLDFMKNISLQNMRGENYIFPSKLRLNSDTI